MAIWNSDPFFEEDLTDPGFWTVKGTLTFASESLMSWTTPLGYTFVLRGSGFTFVNGTPVRGTATDLEIYQGNTLTVTVTSIDGPVSVLFANGMARFFDIMFTDLSQSPRAA